MKPYQLLILAILLMAALTVRTLHQQTETGKLRVTAEAALVAVTTVTALLLVLAVLILAWTLSLL